MSPSKYRKLRYERHVAATSAWDSAFRMLYKRLGGFIVRYLGNVGSALYIATLWTCGYDYSLAEKWINVIYSFLFSTIGPQSSRISLQSARVCRRSISPGWTNRACSSSIVRKGRRAQMSQEKIRFTIACSWGESAVDILFSILP